MADSQGDVETPKEADTLSPAMSPPDSPKTPGSRGDTPNRGVTERSNASDDSIRKRLNLPGGQQKLYGKSPVLKKQLSLTAIEEGLSFSGVVREEFAQISAKKEGLAKAGVKLGSRSIAVAFSGGGIRAAAFQSGVLWRLAESGLLKDVDYLAAVSGGGYISASFFSHLYGMPAPDEEDGQDATQQVKSHYLAVVAKAICRMQRNAGNFVRDPWASGDREGSGYLPRYFDLPMLIGLLLLTIAVNPLQIMIMYVVPVTEIVELYFGHALRAGFCAPDFWLDLLQESSPLGYFLWVIFFTLPLTLVMFLATSGQRMGAKEDDVTSIAYLVLHGLKHFLMRFAMSLVFFTILILLLGFTENLAVKSYDRVEHCQRYISSQRVSQSNCGDLYEEDRWYQRECYLELTKFNLSNTCSERENCTGPRSLLTWQRSSCCAQRGCTKRAPLPTSDRRLQKQGGYSKHNVETPLKLIEKWTPLRVTSVFNLFFTIFLLVLAATFIITPFVPGLFIKVLMVLVPLLYCIVAIVYAQYRIFGYLSGNTPGKSDFHQENYDRWVTFCIFAQPFIVLSFNETQRIWHKYYSRCLQKSFFYNGKDVPLGCLLMNSAEEQTEVFPCPFLLVTGTANDFKPNYSNTSITEISLSPLHTGSRRLGYVRTPNFRTLAKVTALTGAGCLDAISLSMTKLLKLRILLQVLNLSWGDFILFNVKLPEFAERFAYRVPRRWRGVLLSKLHEAPFSILWIVTAVLLYIALHKTRQNGDASCRSGKQLMGIVIFCGCAIFAASFFTFVGPLRFLLISPIIRQFHQFSGFHIRGWGAPGMLYVTDGGVQDCTAIIQLIARRCEHILLVLAAADPQDKLAVLKTAMAVATQKKLGSWYDPEDSRRDINITLEDFAKDPNRTTLRLNILYGWNDSAIFSPSITNVLSSPATAGSEYGPSAGTEVEIGHLLIVKNRLPGDSRMSQVPCPPLLTEDEIRGFTKEGEGVADDPEWKSMKATDLGGLGCCDCCHTRCRCNVGGKFPHLTGANYLWLTPHLFSSLCRLGYESSQEACEELLKVCAVDDFENGNLDSSLEIEVPDSSGRKVTTI